MSSSRLKPDWRAACQRSSGPIGQLVGQHQCAWERQGRKKGLIQIPGLVKGQFYGFVSSLTSKLERGRALRKYSGLVDTGGGGGL